MAESIAADLELAGYTPDQGELVWMQYEELALFNEVASNFLTRPLEPGITAAHFVFSTDIEWDSDYSFANCGVIFRTEDVANGDKLSLTSFASILTPVGTSRYGTMANTNRHSVRHSVIFKSAPTYRVAKAARITSSL